MKERYGRSLIVIVDAAQTRCDERGLNTFLNNGFCVLITGSKFYSGPPFSGALLLPEKEALSLTRMAPGLGDYFARPEFDERLSEAREALPERYNYGLLMRWEAALDGVERYVRISLERRAEIINIWVSNIQKLIQATPYLCNFDNDAHKAYLVHDEGLPGGCNTIVSFTLHPPDDFGYPGRALDKKHLKQIFHSMSDEVSARLPTTANDAEREAVKARCFIGQPVTVNQHQLELSVLRIAIGALLICRINEAAGNGDVALAVEQMLDEDRLLFRKLSVLTKYYDTMDFHT